MNKAEYIKQYNKKYTKRVSLNLSKEKDKDIISAIETEGNCLLYTSPSPRDPKTSRMPSSA